MVASKLEYTNVQESRGREGVKAMTRGVGSARGGISVAGFGSLYLALDVYSFESGGFRAFEERSSLSGEEDD